MEFDISGDCCKSDILCCILGVNPLETRIYFSLMDKELEIEAISSIVGRNRTTVQRSLTQLVNLGIVFRKKIEARHGRKYVYRSLSLEKLKMLLSEAVERYANQMIESINDFENLSED